MSDLLQDIVAIAGFTCMIVVGITGVVMVVARLRRAAAAENMAERAFEASVRDYSRSEPHRTSAVGPGDAMAMGAFARRGDAASSAGPEGSSPPARSGSDSDPSPPATASVPPLPRNPAPASPAAADLPPLAERVVERLRAGGILLGIEGRVRCEDPDLLGTAVTIRGGSRLAILEDPVRREQPALEKVMRAYDGVIAPGPGREPIFVSRFEIFLSERLGGSLLGGTGR